MSKGQRGNKEAKKPKKNQPVVLPDPSSAGLPTLRQAAQPAQKGTRRKH